MYDHNCDYDYISYDYIFFQTRRRRLNGKRVRGILMDLIRGCGDCYNPDVSTSSKSCMHKKESCLRSSSPQIKISPCASPEPSCSNSGQPGRCAFKHFLKIFQCLFQYSKIMMSYEYNVIVYEIYILLLVEVKLSDINKNNVLF